VTRRLANEGTGLASCRCVVGVTFLSITVTQAKHMSDGAQCPICLEDVTDENGSHLALPVCGHEMHVQCALTAVQYDGRCPVCRALVVPRPTPPDTSNDDLLMQIHAEIDLSIRRYNARRARLVRGNERLKLLRDKMKEERKKYLTTEDALIRRWRDMQRQMWAQDQELQQLKVERNRHRRRMNLFSKRMKHGVEDLIGRPHFPDRLIRDLQF
jgi:hypothetical protein